MDTRGRTLCLITTLVCVVNGTASWGQTYNPTASDPTTGNTAGGTGALPSNTRGSWNTGFGRNVLGSNTTGFSNTAFGIDALQANTTGYANTAFGHRALQKNTLVLVQDRFWGNVVSYFACDIPQYLFGS
jgi:hypothetical protein